MEIGYSVLPVWQDHGYATQMTVALVNNVFSMANVERVIAHTTEENPASVAVLARCGFVATGEGRESGLIRFERNRASI